MVDTLRLAIVGLARVSLGRSAFRHRRVWLVALVAILLGAWLGAAQAAEPPAPAPVEAQAEAPAAAAPASRPAPYVLLHACGVTIVVHAPEAGRVILDYLLGAITGDDFLARADAHPDPHASQVARAIVVACLRASQEI